MATRRRSLLAVTGSLAAAALLVTALPASSQAAPSLTLAQAEAVVSGLQQQAEVAQEAYNTDQVRLTQLQSQLGEVNARIARTKATLHAAQAALGGLAAELYTSGGVDQTLQLMLANNPSQFLAEAATLDSVSGRQANALRNVEAARVQLAGDETAAAQKVAAADKLTRAAAASEAQVSDKVAAAQRVVASLQAAQRAALLAQQAAQRAASQQAAQAAAARLAAQQAAQQAQQAQQQPSAPAGGGSGPTYTPPSGGSSIGAGAVAYAMSKVGDPYVWAGAGPYVFDCSGLVMAAYASVGISLPHSALLQMYDSRPVALDALQPGDLVFYYAGVQHVGMYIGGGEIVNAENPSVGVVVTGMYTMPIVGAGRPY